MSFFIKVNKYGIQIIGKLWEKSKCEICWSSLYFNKETQNLLNKIQSINTKGGFYELSESEIVEYSNFSLNTVGMGYSNFNKEQFSKLKAIGIAHDGEQSEVEYLIKENLVVGKYLWDDSVYETIPFDQFKFIIDTWIIEYELFEKDPENYIPPQDRPEFEEYILDVKTYGSGMDANREKLKMQDFFWITKKTTIKEIIAWEKKGIIANDKRERNEEYNETLLPQFKYEINHPTIDHILIGFQDKRNPDQKYWLAEDSRVKKIVLGMKNTKKHPDFPEMTLNSEDFYTINCSLMGKFSWEQIERELREYKSGE